jgi:prophage tail gpP-like protein
MNNPLEQETANSFGNNRKQSKPQGSNDPEIARIFLNKKQYNGWKSFNITRRLDSLSGSFSIDIHDRFREDGTFWPIKPGDQVEMFIGENKIFVGYVDSLSASASETERSVTISGRDLTGDLVDCVPKQQGELKNLTLEQLCNEICAPFGIKVQNVVDDAKMNEKFPVWRIKPGETAFETLDRASKQRGVFLIANDYGQLRITRKGRFRAVSEVVQGTNAKTVSATYDNKDRFSEYKVIGQSSGSDTFSGVQVSSPEAKAFDKGVGRFRPTIIIAETNVDQARAQERANWENTLRSANSFAVNARVVGFFQQDGRLWRVNEIVKVTSGFIGLNRQDLLVRQVSFSKTSEGGTMTTMELTRPDAFNPKKEIEAEADPQNDLGWEIRQAKQRKALERKKENN